MKDHPARIYVRNKLISELKEDILIEKVDKAKKLIKHFNELTNRKKNDKFRRKNLLSQNYLSIDEPEKEKDQRE